MKKNTVAIAFCGLLCATLASGCVSISASSSQSSGTSAEATSAEQTKEAEPQKMELGQTVTAGDYELTITGAEWCDEFKEGNHRVIASNVGGDVLLRLTATVKNNGNYEQYLSSVLKSSLKVNDKYTVEGKVAGTDPGPLATEDVSFYFAVSNDLKEAFENGKVTFEACVPSTEKPASGSYWSSTQSDGTTLYYTSEAGEKFVLDIAQ